MNVFYCENIDSDEAVLSAEESFHCVRVLRLGNGEAVRLIDGKGSMFDAVITAADERECRMAITGKVSNPVTGSAALHIAISPTKSMDRFEWFVEKAVEIGIGVITPLLCRRSERRVLRTDRLQKHILATMKQAMVPFRPVLNELSDYGAFLRSLPSASPNRFIAHCEGEDRKRIRDVYAPGKDAIILIGPEGDFTPEEVSQALSLGFIPISLGHHRLRVETAGVVACSEINLLSDW